MNYSKFKVSNQYIRFSNLKTYTDIACINNLNIKSNLPPLSKWRMGAIPLS